jgi:hypothetical protein
MQNEKLFSIHTNSSIQIPLRIAGIKFWISKTQLAIAKSIQAPGFSHCISAPPRPHRSCTIAPSVKYLIVLQLSYTGAGHLKSLLESKFPYEHRAFIKPTLFLWHLVQDKTDWQRQDAQARCLDSQDSFDIRYISILSKDKLVKIFMYPIPSQIEFHKGWEVRKNFVNLLMPTFLFFKF